MNETIQQRMAEQATGCVQQGQLIYYNEEGEKVTIEKATLLLRSYSLIEVPGAGAGNYEKVFTSLGFEEVEVHDWTSSAGDWSFGVKNKEGWWPASQENRYPYQGFKYSISDLVAPAKSFQELVEKMENI